MRGFKVIVRMFPHEVSDMEPVLALLDKQNAEDFEVWYRPFLRIFLAAYMINFQLIKNDSN